MLPDQMAEAALGHLLALTGSRKLVALAGPPAAGKSTAARMLCERLNAAGRSAVVMPMDGFHLDNRLLESRGLLHRKGSPETFDVAGFGQAISRAAAGGELVFPIFDRRRDVAIAGAGFLSSDTEFVLVEGNYLLLETPPWSQLARYWTFAIWIDAPPGTIRQRLVERWLDEGLPEAEARARAAGNDLPNAELVLANRRPCDLSLCAEA